MKCTMVGYGKITKGYIYSIQFIERIKNSHPQDTTDNDHQLISAFSSLLPINIKSDHDITQFDNGQEPNPGELQRSTE